MITLKPYQERVLDSLRDFFRQCAQDGRPEAAFQAVQFNNGSSSPVTAMLAWLIGAIRLMVAGAVVGVIRSRLLSLLGVRAAL